MAMGLFVDFLKICVLNFQTVYGMINECFYTLMNKQHKRRE